MFFNTSIIERMTTNYRTYIIRSWHWYQRTTSSDKHTIEDYNKDCENDAANLYEKHVMVLRDNITKIKGYYFYSNGFPIQNVAETDGYIDVRTGKKYNNIHEAIEDMHCVR